MKPAEKAVLVGLLRQIGAAMRGMAENIDAVAALFTDDTTTHAPAVRKPARSQLRPVNAPDLTDADHQRANENLRRIGMYPRETRKSKR